MSFEGMRAFTIEAGYIDSKPAVTFSREAGSTVQVSVSALDDIFTISANSAQIASTLESLKVFGVQSLDLVRASNDIRSGKLSWADSAPSNKGNMG